MEPPYKGGSGSEEGGGPGLPGSQAAAVQASLQERREAQPAGGHTPGEGEATAVAAADIMQLARDGGLRFTEGQREGPGGGHVDAEKRAGGTGVLSTTPWAEECEQGEDRREAEPAWTEVVKNGRHKKNKTGMQNEQGQGVEEEELTEEYNQNSRLDMDRSLARLREERQRTSTPHKRVGDSRQGDWTCKDVKCAWQNFARRRVCMKCSKDRRGLMGPEQGAAGGTQGVAPGRRENAIRHPKLLILSINLTKDGKTGQRPRWEDHVNIMRQAGLNLDKVRGKVGKNGYLEVALEPGSTSAVGALREVSKEVDTRYTIQSVREQGASREVTVRWVRWSPSRLQTRHYTPT